MRNVVKTLCKGKRRGEKLLYECGLKNRVNLLTCRQISYERTIGPFEETYGENVLKTAKFV